MYFNIRDRAERLKEMKTNEETNLVWKLKDLPDATEIADLVAQKVITPEEGRKILFSEKTNEELENEKIAALEEQIKFLRGVVDKLSSQSPQIVYKYINDYRPREVWLSTSTPTPFKLTGGTVMANLANSISSGSINGGSLTMTAAGTGSTSINTAKIN